MSATGQSEPCTAFDVVCLCGSAGALQPLLTVLRRLPPRFPAAVVVHMHGSDGGSSLLPELVRARSALPVSVVQDEAQLQCGRVHLAAPGGRLVARAGGGIAAVDSERPGAAPRSADAILTSLADNYGAGTLAIVLSGRLDDGAAGALAVKRAGGRVLVQQPTSCRWPAMPTAAVATGAVDFALPPGGLAAAVVALVMVTGAADLFVVRSHPGLVA